MRADDGTSAAATLQVRLGAGPFRNYLRRHIQLYNTNQHHSRADGFQYPNFGNADRCNAMMAGQENKAKLFSAYFCRTLRIGPARFYGTPFQGET